MRERKETFSIKEPKKDAHDKYPSYGRGLKDPGVKLNTFMVQEQMCDDPKEKKRKERASSNSPMSEKSPVRKKIVSPKRSRFEKRFREYLEKKFITDQIPEKPMPKMDFDTTTKPEGTLNAKVNQKRRWLERERLRKELINKKKSLPQMEKDAEQVLQEEVVIHLGEEMLKKLRDVFDLIRQRDKIDGEELETQELVYSIAEDHYFSTRLNKEVRLSVDGEKETLENLLHRVLEKSKS